MRWPPWARRPVVPAQHRKLDIPRQRTADAPARILDAMQPREVHFVTQDALAHGALGGRFKALCGRSIFAAALSDAGHKLCRLCAFAVDPAVAVKPAALRRLR